MSREIERIMDEMERTRPTGPWPDTHRSTDPGPRSPYDELGYLRFDSPFSE